MKRLFTAMAMVLVLTMTACGGNRGNVENEKEEVKKTEETSGTNMAQISNPFQDCSTLKEAAGIAGFEMTAPETLEGYENCLIQAVEGRMIQTIFYQGEMDGDDVLARVLLRKGIGSNDISGDYNEYTETEEADADGRRITMKGQEGKIYMAIWMDGDFSYAIDFDEGADMETVINIAKQMN